MPESDVVNIVLAADANFAKQLAVAVAGIVRHLGDRVLRVFVLQAGYDAELRGRVERVARGGTSFSWHEASVSGQHADALPEFLAPATIFRLRMEDLLPAEIRRVVYLDADIVVRGSLAELWATDIGDALVGAVRDAGAPWSGAVLDWRRLDVPPQRPYFNAGVLVVPLDRWREERVSVRALELLAAGGLPFGDQCALNLAVEGRWTPIAPRWNVQSEHLIGDRSLAWLVEDRAELDRALDDPTVVHFTHGRWHRPWDPWPNHPYVSEWFDVLDSTPWSGWRPVMRPQGPVSRALGRAQRAGQVLRHGKY